MHAPPSRAQAVGDLPLTVGVVLAVCVWLTRLPFVFAGYGTDTDTWKFAIVIREIADTGHYTASRVPGYPLMELACAPLAHLGPWAPNLLSAVAAAACAWLVARLFARYGARDAALAGAAFAFVPEPTSRARRASITCGRSRSCWRRGSMPRTVASGARRCGSGSRSACDSRRACSCCHWAGSCGVTPAAAACRARCDWRSWPD